MTMFEKNDGVGTAAASAPSEWTITTPSGEASEPVNEGADGGDIGLPLDAVALSGMSPRARLIRRGLSSSPAYMFAALVVIFVVFAVLAPATFPHWDNVQLVISNAAVLLTMAVGMTFVMVAAGFDLSIGSVLVFSGSDGVEGHVGLGGQGYGTLVIGLLVALVGGCAWGAFNGFCVTRLRVPALITTLGSLGAALGIANLITDGNDVSTVPNSLITIQTESWFGFPPIFYIAVVVVLVGGATLRYTQFGRHTYVVGSNDEAARRAGINVSEPPAQAVRDERRAGRPRRDDVAHPLLHHHHRRPRRRRAERDHRRDPRWHQPLRRRRHRSRDGDRHVHPRTCCRTGSSSRASSRSGRTWRSASSSSSPSTSTNSSAGPATEPDPAAAAATVQEPPTSRSTSTSTYSRTTREDHP